MKVLFERVEREGKIKKRKREEKMKFESYGEDCKLWNVKKEFEKKGRIIRKIEEKKDGERYICIEKEMKKREGGFKEKKRS